MLVLRTKTDFVRGAFSSAAPQIRNYHIPTTAIRVSPCITWLLQTSPQNSLPCHAITLTTWRLPCTTDWIFKLRCVTWEEAELAAQNRSEWRRSVTQCIHLDEGWIKVTARPRCITKVLHYINNTHNNAHLWRAVRCCRCSVVQQLHTGQRSAQGRTQVDQRTSSLWRKGSWTHLQRDFPVFKHNFHFQFSDDDDDDYITVLVVLTLPRSTQPSILLSLRDR